MEGTTKKQKLSTLDQLKEITVVVADTGDFEGNCYIYYFTATICSLCSLSVQTLNLRQSQLNVK